MIDKKEVSVRKVICKRLEDARELAVFDLIEAANLLGISKTELKAIEDGGEISLGFILKASNVYDVSVDYLFGISDDWERSEDIKLHRKVGRWVYEAHQANTDRWLNNSLRHKKKIDCLSDVVQKILQTANEAYSGLVRFKELNAGFDDMPGGSMIAYRHDQLSEQINQCQCQLKRSKIIQFYSEITHD